MMGRKHREQASLFYEFRLDDMIPKGHLLRRINVFVTSVLGDLHEQLGPFYSDISRGDATLGRLCDHPAAAGGGLYRREGAVRSGLSQCPVAPRAGPGDAPPANSRERPRAARHCAGLRRGAASRRRPGPGGARAPVHARPARRDQVPLFFPTGGGKTEAYLGLAAWTIAHRRITNSGTLGAGVAVLMRYTLRLLTLDQLSRAAGVVCALELMRGEPTWQENGKYLLGDWPIEIGLWVGSAASRTASEKRATDATIPPSLASAAFAGTAARPLRR
jgi:hypothetical protein